MKNILIIVILFILSSCSLNKEIRTNKGVNENEYSYSRNDVLKNISLELNKLDLKYKLHHPMKYSVTNENLYNFFVYDLVDTTNVTPNIKKIKIEFLDKHVYHIASLNNYFKTSIVLILYKGKLYFFNALNCINNINSIKDVIDFIESKKDLNYSESVKDRIINYYKFDKSYSVDEIGKIPLCECQVD